MFLPGRPPDGYSDFENIFYLLNIELENTISILKFNYEQAIEKFNSDYKFAQGEENIYLERVQKINDEYVKKGENPIIALDIAENDASLELNVEKNTFYHWISNIEFIKELTINGLNKSTFVMIYSAIEYFLIRLCEILKNRISTKLDIDDFKSLGYINTCFLYFDKVINVNYDFGVYDKFKKFQLIRNTIVHNNSFLKGKDSKSIEEILQVDNVNVKIKEERFLFCSNNFVENFYKTSTKLLESLEANIELKFDFPTLLYQMKYLLGSGLILRDDEKIYISDNTLFYKAKIFDSQKKYNGNLTISFVKAKKSTSQLEIEKKSQFLTKEELEDFFNATKRRVRDGFKKYRSLINGKRSFTYIMKIH